MPIPQTEKSASGQNLGAETEAKKAEIVLQLNVYFVRKWSFGRVKGGKVCCRSIGEGARTSETLTPFLSIGGESATPEGEIFCVCALNSFFPKFLIELLVSMLVIRIPLQALLG